MFAPEAQRSLIELRGESSSTALLLSVAALGAIAYLLFYWGVIGWVVGLFSRFVRWAVRAGFRAWEFTIAWASWWAILASSVGLLTLGFLLVRVVPAAGFGIAGLCIAVGVTTCLACMFVEIERYDVSRGYKAVHNPLKGQELAVHVVLYGHQVGILLLVSATVATVGGFGLLNYALYSAGYTAWYRVEDHRAGAADFLAYALLNLVRVVDIFDVMRSKHLLDATIVRPGHWAANLLVIVYRSFFTLVLLQQIFASIRQGRLLAETITDFWSPHDPIQVRARNALPQYGAGAIHPLLTSLRSVSALTKEQRDQLPAVLAAIGPCTVPPLSRQLHDRHEHVRAVCAAALGRLNALDALPTLLALERDESEFVRQSLAEALGSIAAAARTAEPPARRRWFRRRRPWWFRRRFADCATSDPVPAAVQCLRSLLQDSHAAVRGQAAQSIRGIGPPAAAAVPDLVERLSDPDETVRCGAAEALGAVGPGSAEAIAALAGALEDPSAAVRAAVARGLAAMGPAAASAARRLVEVLRDRDPGPQAAAADALPEIGPLDGAAVRSLIEELGDRDSAVRARATEVLGSLESPPAEAADALARMLRDRTDAVRARAAAALGKIGPGAAVAVPHLVRALRDSDSSVSALAADALGTVGVASRNVITALTRALAHVNAQVRANAALALGRLRADGDRVRAALKWAASDVDGGVRAQAVRALGRTENGGPEWVAVVREALNDGDPLVREAGVEALGQARQPPDVVAALVLPLLGDANDQVKLQAIDVLTRQVGPAPAVIEGICNLLLRDDSTRVQAYAARGIGGLGPAAADCGPALVRAAQTGDAGVRRQAMRALAAIRPADARDAFRSGLRDADTEVRAIASEAWGEVPSIDDEAARALAEAARDPEGRVRLNAVRALARVRRLPDGTVPAVIDCLQEADGRIRLHAAVALSTTPTPEAVDALEGLLDDPDGRIRRVAAAAVLKADPGHASARTVQDLEANTQDETLTEFVGLETTGDEPEVRHLPAGTD